MGRVGPSMFWIGLGWAGLGLDFEISDGLGWVGLGQTRWVTSPNPCLLIMYTK